MSLKKEIKTKALEATFLSTGILADGICDIQKGNTEKGWQSVRFSLAMFGVLLVILLAAIYHLLQAI